MGKRNLMIFGQSLHTFGADGICYLDDSSLAIQWPSRVVGSNDSSLKRVYDSNMTITIRVDPSASSTVPSIPEITLKLEFAPCSQVHHY